MSHEDVEEAAVLGVERDEWGEIPVAFAVCGAGASATELDIICIQNRLDYLKEG